MSDIAIRVEGLGKCYRLGQQVGYKTLRETVLVAYHTPTRVLGQRVCRMRWTEDRGPKTEVAGRPSPVPSHPDHLWALKDVSFEVKQGEAVGIIGRNGSGKSTLLKILSRITAPTEGHAEIHGRIGSLLEVGTGFHPELTGRENIYLNGAIIGMKKAEIDRRFEEIVAFAEIEKFLDTPVKRYSSGMYVRLAFAVAAHLEPEVLVVDEVLAVGDVEFQKKCLSKMEDVTGQGRTVLFVSHNMGTVSQLCPRTIVLAEGRNTFDGDTATGLSTYLKGVETAGGTATFQIDPRKNVQITSMSVIAPDGEAISNTPHNRDFQVVVEYVVQEWRIGSYVCLDVFNEDGVRLLWSSDARTAEDMLCDRAPGTYQGRITVPGMVLSPGQYTFTAAVYAPGRATVYDVKEKVVSLQIVDGGSFLSSLGIKPHAATMIPMLWETKRLNG